MPEIILVTGGFGYLGGRIARHISLQNNLTPRISTRRDNAALPSWLPKGEIVRWDPLDSEDSAGAEKAVRGARQIIHLAGANEIESAKDPAKALEATAGGTKRLLDAAIQSGGEKFLYFSTIHVYGSPLPELITEETPTNGTHPYATTHLAAEKLVLEARAAGKIDGIVVRLSNGFGAPTHPAIDRWTLIVNDLCRQAVTQKKLVMRSSGLQRRDLIGMADICRAALHLLSLPRAKSADGLFNVGGGAAPRMIEVAESVATRCEKILGFRPPIERPAPAPNESSPPLDYRIDKLAATGFRPSASMNDEIDETLRFCQEISISKTHKD